MTYRFGVFEFDAAVHELRRNGRRVAIEPQPGRALACLVSRAGAIVSREDLKQVVWDEGTHVDFDRGLAYCVSQVRAALGDSGDNPRFVETIPRRGYRFIAPVSGVEAARPAPDGVADGPARNDPPGNDTPHPETPRGATRLTRAAYGAMGLLVLTLIGWAWVSRGQPAPPAPARVVVAVSIFDNETGDARYDRLVAGLSDLVVTRLTATDPRRLAVVGNASVLRQPRNIRRLEQVASALDAQYVVLGQLQRSDAGFRFITHLIRLADLTHLKANRIVMPDGDLSGLEGAVVDEFDRAVRAHILTSAP